MKTAMIGVTTTLLLVLAATPAMAGTVYSNGSVNGTIGGWLISLPDTAGDPSDAVSDSFTVSQDVAASGVSFGVWAFPGAMLSSVDWSIGTMPFANDVGSGSSTVNQSFLSSNTAYNFDIDEDFFSFAGPVALTAGTYYLTLQNAVGTDGDPFYWDENDGPSAAYDYDVDFGTTVLDSDNGAGSESFSIVTPEPNFRGSVAIFMIGVTFALRRRRGKLGSEQRLQ